MLHFVLDEHIVKFLRNVAFPCSIESKYGVSWTVARDTSQRGLPARIFTCFMACDCLIGVFVPLSRGQGYLATYGTLGVVFQNCLHSHGIPYLLFISIADGNLASWDDHILIAK